MVRVVNVLLIIFHIVYGTTQFVEMDQSEQIQRLTEAIANMRQELDKFKGSFHDSNVTSNACFTDNSAVVDDVASDSAEYEKEYFEPTCWRCGQKGHIKKGCMVRLDHSRRHAAAYRISKDYNLDIDPYRPYNSRYSKRAQVAAAMPTGLVGNSNEAEIVINDVRVNALIDTGASVSTISDTFYRNYLSHLVVTFT